MKPVKTTYMSVFKHPLFTNDDDTDKLGYI